MLNGSPAQWQLDKLDQLEGALLTGTIADPQYLQQQLRASMQAHGSAPSDTVAPTPSSVTEASTSNSVAPTRGNQHVQSTSQKNGAVAPSKVASAKTVAPSKAASAKAVAPSKAASEKTVAPTRNKQNTSVIPSQAVVEAENIITFEATTESNTSWITDQDTHEVMETTEPEESEEDIPEDIQQVLHEEMLEAQARHELITEGLTFELPRWLRKDRPPTVQIISDSFLKNWPQDNRCHLLTEDTSNIQQITHAVRSQSMRIQLPVTIVLVRAVRQIECLEPLKNAIQSLCRAIRVFSPAGRIFIASTTPSPNAVPVLGLRAHQHNKMLFQAVIGVNKKLTRVFYMALADHIWDGKEYIQPIRQYFDTEGDLTYHGCVLIRSCMFREAGLAPYSL